MRALAVILALGLAAPVAAQSTQAETLADIRQELNVLFVEIQKLKREQSTTGSPGVTLGGGALARLSAVEQELMRLTAKTEDLELRLDRIVQDGTNRVGDLEFRLCELEPDCDLAQLEVTTTLGGETESVTGPAPATPLTDSPELAVGERADFDRAQTLYDAQDWPGAASAFGDFTSTYPGGPLSAEAHFLRGEAEAAQGAWGRAARAYLDSFSGTPNGPRSADALFKLGISLDKIGQRNEACVTLREVSFRFPNSEAATNATQTADALACP